MNPDITPGAKFPDFELPDHRGRLARLSSLTAPTPYDEILGFTDGYPLIVVFYRGFFCPRDGAQMRQLVHYQAELSVNYCKLVAISADKPKVCGAYRYGLGAAWPFLSDEKRAAIDALGIRDETEEEYPGCAIPTTFVLSADLTIHKIYDGWFFVGRPTIEELRHDLRELMSRRRNYTYESYNQPEIKRICIPAEYWEHGAPPLGATGNPVARGVVEWFSVDDGYGVVKADDGRSIFLRFSGIPGLGYRTVRGGSEVEFEIVAGPMGHWCATNLRVLREGERWGLGSLTATNVSGMNR
ncbi:MAG: redoxin domain-containing protein [Anaerolineales bacterium]